MGEEKTAMKSSNYACMNLKTSQVAKQEIVPWSANMTWPGMFGHAGHQRSITATAPTMVEQIDYSFNTKEQRRITDTLG